MIVVKLEKLSAQNWKECAELKLKEEQTDSLPDNWTSIAELNFYPETKAFAIKNEEGKVVGFATYGMPVGESYPKLFRLMIDKDHQGKGYGKAALKEILNRMFEEYKSEKLQVCYRPNDPIVKKFYESVGFQEKAILESKIRPEGKVLAELEIRNFEF